MNNAGFMLISRQTKRKYCMEKKKETDNIINSLDGLQKASPGPYFYTRVRARLLKEETGIWGSIALFFTKPVVALTTLCLIFLLNTAAFLYQHESAPAMTDQTEQASTEDYNTTLAAKSYYDENTETH